MSKRIILAVIMAIIAFTQAYAAELMQLVPQNAGFVVKINVEKLLSSPEVKAYIEKTISEHPKEYAEYKAKSGLDPLKDVSKVVFFMPNNFENNKDDMPSAAIIEGKFDINKLKQSIKETPDSLELSEEDGFTVGIYTYKDKKSQKELKSKMAIIDNETIAFGTENGTNCVMAVKNNQMKNLTTESGFYQTATNLNNEAHVGAAIILPQSIKEMMASKKDTEPISKISYVSLEVTKNKEFEIVIKGDVTNSGDAEPAQNVIKQFIEGVKAMQAPYAALKDFVRNMKTSVSGKTIRITSSISQEAIDRLIATKGAPEVTSPKKVK